MKLYEINAKIEKYIFDSINFGTGEILTEIISSRLPMTQLIISKEQVVLSTACMIKSLEAEAEAHANEERIQKRKRQVLENKANRLKEYLKGGLEVGDKFNDSRISVAYRENGQQKLVIDVPFTEIPSCYLNRPTIDKVELKKWVALGASEGKTHPYAHLEPSDPSLVIK